MNKFSLDRFKKSYTFRHEPEQYVRFARAFWAILLFLTSILICAGLIFGAWQFVFLRKSVNTSVPPAGISGFNKEQLRTIVATFEKRQAEFEGMMSGE